MKRGSHTRSAVVGDRRPLERNLARFLLEERGFVVAAEAATAGDVASAVEQHRPDVVLVHESVALEQAALIPGIRTTSPTTRVIVLTTDRAAADPALVVAADSVVEEGPGLKELAAALAPRTGPPAIPARRTAAAVGPVAAVSTPSSRRVWADRFQGAIAASIIVLAAVLARGAGPNAPVAPQETPARIHIAAAEQTLNVLADGLREASPQEVAELARQLLEERAFAIASGADTQALDAHIAAALGPVLDSLGPQVQEVLLQVLGSGLIYGDAPPPVSSPSPTSSPPAPDRRPPDPSPNPSPSPEPAVTSPTPQPEPPPPSPSPSPSPSESPSPSPSESPSPSPSESPSPSPSESPSPSPSESPSPSPSPSSPSPSPSERSSPSPTVSPSPSPSGDPSESPGPTTTPSPRPSPSESPSPSPSETPPENTNTPPPCPSAPPDSSHPCKPSHPPKPDDRHGPSATAAGAVYVVPPALLLLLFGSGLARRFGARRDDGR